MVMRFISMVLSAIVLQAAEGDSMPSLPVPIQYGPAKRLASLANREIIESSGLACSRIAEGVFWTHNDSGDRARVFALDTEGKHLGSFTVPGARAIDWEDMASVRRGGHNLLLLADMGDNHRDRSSYTIYVVEEPQVVAASNLGEHEARLVQKIDFRFEDGPNNCESVAVDPVRDEIILVSKQDGDRCKAYRLAWPKKANGALVVAHLIARPALPKTTAMDISPDGLRAVVLTYGDAYEFRRARDEDWGAGLSRAPRRLPMPKRAQGESICYGPGGQTLYLTSEKLPCPLWRVAPRTASH